MRHFEIAIEPLPNGTTIATAGRPRVPPDPAIVMPLVEMIAISDDSQSLRIIIEQLPARAGIAVAGRTGRQRWRSSSRCYLASAIPDRNRRWKVYPYNARCGHRCGVEKAGCPPPQYLSYEDCCRVAATPNRNRSCAACVAPDASVVV